jgi:uncharacterized beta-barrel protein YwiB (DUF1934 family)
MKHLKQVLVTVQSIQRDENGQDLKIELVSTGKYYEKKNARYIVYEESEITGMAGVTTIIKIIDGVIVLLRLGKIHQRQEFRKGQTARSSYKMPFGVITVGMKTYELNIDLDDGIGTIEIGYDVIIEGIGTNYNQLTITVQEDKA